MFFDLLDTFGFENDLGQLSAALDILAIEGDAKADCHIVHGELLPVSLREGVQVVAPLFDALGRVLLGHVQCRPLLEARRTLDGAQSVGEFHRFLLRERLGRRRVGVGVLIIQSEAQLSLRHASRVRLDLQLLLLGLYRVRDSDPRRSVALKVSRLASGRRNRGTGSDLPVRHDCVLYHLQIPHPSSVVMIEPHFLDL